jgi:DNA-binding CsgD family transcriptional regulator/cbb3-type cytochrome oxidase subunit 3
MTHERQMRRNLVVSTLLVGGIAVAMGADIVEDLSEGMSAGHMALEGGIVLLMLCFVAWQWWQWRESRRHAAELGRQLDDARLQATRFRAEAAEAVASFGAAIDKQLDRWSLTEAERDVARLLLRGLSHKEIANLRETSERTVRQQSLAVYRKSGLGGRSELAAFFLEDLLVERQPERAHGGEQRPALAPHGTPPPVAN